MKSSYHTRKNTCEKRNACPPSGQGGTWSNRYPDRKAQRRPHLGRVRLSAEACEKPSQSRALECIQRMDVNRIPNTSDLPTASKGFRNQSTQNNPASNSLGTPLCKRLASCPGTLSCPCSVRLSFVALVEGLTLGHPWDFTGQEKETLKF